MLRNTKQQKEDLESSKNLECLILHAAKPLPCFLDVPCCVSAPRICTEVLEHYSCLFLDSILPLGFSFNHVLDKDPQIKAGFSSYVFPHCPVFPTITAVIFCYNTLFTFLRLSLSLSFLRAETVNQVHQFCLQHQSGKVSRTPQSPN